MDCPPGQKSGRCREVAVSGGSTVFTVFNSLEIQRVNYSDIFTSHIPLTSKNMI